MKKQNRVLYILQEVSIVVVGVLIAVSIGNYKEQADNEAYVGKTLLAIENEVKYSQSELDTVLNRHLDLYETLETEIENEEQTLGELLSASGGFQIASLKNVSLRFFVSNKAELLEFQLISQLLDIELKGDLLSDKIKLLTNFAYENVNERSYDVKLKFAYLFANVIDGEQTLLESYTDFLTKNETTLSPEK